MTEIPEHLLARSRERRAAVSGEESPEASSPTESAAVEAAPAATPAPAAEAAPPEPPAPAPVPPYVAAANSRKKMPYWASTIMVILPIWAIFYVGMLEPPTTNELDLAGNGATVFATCASCHGGDGSGSATGRQLNDGEVTATFPYRDDFVGLSQHLSWVYLGTESTQDLSPDDDFYGAPGRAGGQREAGSFEGGIMGGFSNLELDDLVSVVYYERVTHGTLTPEEAAIEAEMLLALAEEHPDLTADASPDHIGELLQEAAEAHGVDLEELATE